MKKRIFSGVKPSGDLHIGNYIGAIKNWVKLQDEFESIFCVVDLHAITVPQDPVELRKRTIEIAKVYLAAGIDPKKCSIFIQSHISEHTELAWILNTITKVSEMERMTQFKDKSQKDGRENAGLGLFDYPVLMAADIILYDTQVVPVGEDQLQHIEITRTLARRFNSRFGETFVVPEAYITKEGMRIMGLDDPTKKMSKSAKSEYNFIALSDSPEAIRKKIKKAVTDSGSEIVYRDDLPTGQAGKPALKNLINIYSLLGDLSVKDIEKKYKGKGPASTRGDATSARLDSTRQARGGYAQFKSDLAEVIVDFLVPFQKRMKEMTDEKVMKILAEGAERVRPIAAKKMAEVKKKVGFIS